MKRKLLFISLGFIILFLVVSVLSIASYHEINVANKAFEARVSSWRWPEAFTLGSITTQCTGETTTINLAWTTSKNATSYVVQKATATGRWWTDLSSVLAPITSFTDSFAVKEATTLSYRIKALNGFLSTYSNIQKVNLSVCQQATPIIPPPSTTPPPSQSSLLWGAYVGDGQNDLANFESLVGKKVNILADFEGWNNSFPLYYVSKVGQQGKTLIIFWEPSFGYDSIINGSKDSYIKQFAADAKTYGYPVILVPFDEMNLNEEAWGYGKNGNTAAKFIQAWRHVHDLFTEITNVKFGIAYNNVSVPNVSGNQFSDYYPDSAYVDYVGVDGFNFGNPWQTFAQLFDSAIAQLQSYGKPLYIFSMASTSGSQKASWITEGLGTHIRTYTNVAGWIWFNQNDGTNNWLVNSDSSSLQAFKAILP